MYQMLKEINDNFCKDDQLDEDVLRESAIDFYAEMSDEEFTKRRNYFINNCARSEDERREFDESPGIKEKLLAMERESNSSVSKETE